ncbi:MAG: hypothetical protein ACI3YE_04000 [Candidatus Avispirillum sp.]
MALGCIGGSGECDGCGACMRSPSYRCSCCGTPIKTGSLCYKFRDKTVCTRCVMPYDGGGECCDVCGEDAGKYGESMFEAGGTPLCARCLERAKAAAGYL